MTIYHISPADRTKVADIIREMGATEAVVEAFIAGWSLPQAPLDDGFEAFLDSLHSKALAAAQAAS